MLCFFFALEHEALFLPCILIKLYWDAMPKFQKVQNSIVFLSTEFVELTMIN